MRKGSDRFLTRILPRALIQVLRAGALLGCSGSAEVGAIPNPPAGYPVAFAEPECAPWDGAAVAIYLVDAHPEGNTVPYPHLRISIWRSAAEVAGRIIRWRGDNRSIGVAVRCSDAGKCQRANSVEVRFRLREADGSIPGYVVLEFEDGVSATEGFGPRGERGGSCVGRHCNQKVA